MPLLESDIDWGNKIINIRQAYLLNITGTLYEMDTETFRTELIALLDDVWGIAHQDAQRHATEVTVAGTTYARVIEIINGYTIEFEDGQYSVRLVGSNNNFFDVENGILAQNQVQVIPGNAAGLIIHLSAGGSALTQEEHDHLMSLPKIGKIIGTVGD